MQEVQNQWNTYQENHEIEQIGYTSRKISDKMQVRDREASGVSTDEKNVGVDRAYNTDPNSQYNQIGFTVADTFGNTDYRITSDGVLIPLAGGYHITGYVYGGANSVILRFQFRVNGEVIREITTNSVNSKWYLDITLNLGKYDALSVYAHIDHYTGGGQYISATAYAQLNIAKL